MDMQTLSFPLELTESAIERLDELLKPGEAFRVAIRGGGCAGMEYEFSTEREEITDIDLEQIVRGHIKIRVDRISANHLTGATLDFKSERFNSYFVIQNPNAKASCGCGKSVSL